MQWDRTGSSRADQLCRESCELFSHLTTNGRLKGLSMNREPLALIPERGLYSWNSERPVAQNMEYIRTSSSFHGWQEAHPDRKSRSSGGNGDCIDELFEE